jgi:UrcA family protein
MDTINASPKSASHDMSGQRIPGILTVALAGAVAIWLIAIATETATAQSAPGAPGAVESAERVTYADLDLNSAAGARTLLHRIDLAARRICGPSSHSPLEPRAASLNRRCVIEAVDMAVARIDAPLLAAVHTNKSSAGASLALR